MSDPWEQVQEVYAELEKERQEKMEIQSKLDEERVKREKAEVLFIEFKMKFFSKGRSARFRTKTSTIGYHDEKVTSS